MKNKSKNKLLIYLLVASGALSACGGSESSGETGLSCSTFTGHYVSDVYADQTMDVDGSCNFTDSFCGYTASFTVPVGNVSTVTVAGTNGAPGCLASTSHTCGIELTGGKLYVDCGGSNFDILTKE